MEMKATRDAYGEKLVELGEKNKDIVVLDADLAKSTKTTLFGKRFPHRFFDMGIAEQSMIGTAAGLALSGKIPFASTFAVFATGRVYDQLRMSVCYPKVNVKIVATHGGLTVGEDGASHQALEDIALARALPNMAVVVPCDAVETGKVIEFAAEYRGPMYVRLGRSKIPIINNENYSFNFGKGTVLKEGNDVTLVAIGIMVSLSLEAANILREKGIEAEVINMSTVKPLDGELLVESARKTGAVVTAEEHTVIGGLGGAVAEVLVENFPVPMERIGVRDVFGESGAPEELLEKYRLSTKYIVRAAERVISRK